MTIQKLARLSRRFMGWVVLSLGILIIAGSAWICFRDDRTKMIVFSITQMFAGVFFVWFGARRISESKACRLTKQ